MLEIRASPVLYFIGGVTCTAHGGGEGCEHLGCTTAARDGSVTCIAHGGGEGCEPWKGWG